MFRFPRASVLILVAAGMITAESGAARAAEDVWESQPDGAMGRAADFEGAGGVKVLGYVRKPARRSPMPIVIMLHGGGSFGGNPARAVNSLGHSSNPPIPDFLAQGWAVYSIDYRPNARYKIDPLEIDDTLAAVNKAKSFSFVDPKRMAMFGGSHGGHITARMTSRTSLACAVVCAPAGLDLIAISQLAEKHTPIGGNQGLIRELEQRTGTKMAQIAKDPAACHYSSPLTEAAQVKCPILLISGRNDNNCPRPVVELYADKLRAAGKEVETYQPDNGPHGFYVGLPHAIPETTESTRRAVTFIALHFGKVVP